MTDHADVARSELAARAGVVGVSEGHTCGVRDHAVLLSGALGREQVACSTHWLWRRDHGLAGSRSEFSRWTAALPGELAAEGVEVIILHYSVFSYSYRGLPVFVAPTLSALRASGVPVIAFLHEFVYPWRRGGLRGKTWAVSQRGVLAGVLRTSSAVVVTTELGASWLSSRPWLPRRPIAVTPVFSNLPPPPDDRSEAREARTIGLFGYAYEGAAVLLVLDALALLRDRGLTLTLALLGAPGPDAPAAELWRSGARERGLERSLRFSGVLGAEELSSSLISCQVLLHPEPAGPTSRKGTLAGSLGSGRPVVAIDGPRRWQKLIDARAALVVAPTARGLADGLTQLLGDDAARESLGARGRAFARSEMSVERSAGIVAGLIAEVLGSSRPVGPRAAG